MDPLGLIASVITVSALGVKVVHVFDRLLVRWDDVEVSSRALQAQCQTFSSSLTLLTQFVKEQGVQSPTSTPFFQSLALSVEGCATFLLALSSELWLCRSIAKPNSKRQKALFLWNGSKIRELQVQLNHQTQGLALLLQM